MSELVCESNIDLFVGTIETPRDCMKEIQENPTAFYVCGLNVAVCLIAIPSEVSNCRQTLLC